MWMLMLALAGQDPAPPVVITNPDWAALPDVTEMGRLYPIDAAIERTNGRVTLRCTVESDGSLTDCAVQSEAPQNMGFGEASLRIAESFRMHPQTRDGQPVGGATVVVPIVWIAPEIEERQVRGPPAAMMIRPIRRMDPEQIAFCVGLARTLHASGPSPEREGDVRLWTNLYEQLVRERMSAEAIELRLSQAEREAASSGFTVSCRITLSGRNYMLFDPRETE